MSTTTHARSAVRVRRTWSIRRLMAIALLTAAPAAPSGKSSASLATIDRVSSTRSFGARLVCGRWRKCGRRRRGRRCCLVAPIISRLNDAWYGRIAPVTRRDASLVRGRWLGFSDNSSVSQQLIEQRTPLFIYGRRIAFELLEKLADIIGVDSEFIRDELISLNLRDWSGCHRLFESRSRIEFSRRRDGKQPDGIGWAGFSLFGPRTVR